MRLSEVLSKAPDTSRVQVEGFLGSRKIGWGSHRSIEVGKVIRNYLCTPCGEMRTFLSGHKLSCLVTGDSTVSVDTTLQCSACSATTEAWFLVGCDDDLYSAAPTVYLERYTENRRDAGADPSLGGEVLGDLLERAHIAFGDRLGAGSMVYLRKVFEIATAQAANAVGIPTTTTNGRPKNFRALLTEVDEECHIIPTEFSSNGYKLFSELSDVIHGEADESDALARYIPCRRLVLGVIHNIQNSQEFALAIASLGWDEPVSLGATPRAAL